MNWDPKSAPKLDFNEDFYAVLDVDPLIDQKDLKRAYYKIVFRYHPDNKEGEAAKALCNKQMMVINNAYKVLKEVDQRAIYDRKRQLGLYGNAATKGSYSSSSQQQKSSSGAGAQSRSRSTSSSGGSPSSRNPGSSQESFFNWQQQVDEPVESLGDIFTELWGEIRRGGASHLLEELVDFLEDQVPGSRASGYESVAESFAGKVKSNQGVKSKSELDSEITVLTTALSNLQLHLTDLSKLRTAEEDAILKTPTSNAKTVEELEARLKKIEALRGLSARIEEVQKQQRQLQRQIKTAQDTRNRLSADATAEYTKSSARAKDPYSTSSPNPFGSPSPPAEARSQVVVDQELLKLKRKMGLK